jgi:hypothetical protein
LAAADSPAWRRMRKSLRSPEQSELLALLTATRRQKGLTQQVLAIRLERPQSFVAKHENGERRLDVIEFVAIVRAIGADPVKLLARFIAGPAQRPKTTKSPRKRARSAGQPEQKLFHSRRREP